MKWVSKNREDYMDLTEFLIGFFAHQAYVSFLRGAGFGDFIRSNPTGGNGTGPGNPAAGRHNFTNDAKPTLQPNQYDRSPGFESRLIGTTLKRFPSTLRPSDRIPIMRDSTFSGAGCPMAQNRSERRNRSKPFCFSQNIENKGTLFTVFLYLVRPTQLEA